MAALLSLLIVFVIPLGLTLWLGATRRRVLWLLAFGPAAILAWLLVGLLRTGGWIDALNAIFLALWAVLWILGVGLGFAVRRERERPERRPRKWVLLALASLCTPLALASAIAFLGRSNLWGGAVSVVLVVVIVLRASHYWRLADQD